MGPDSRILEILKQVEAGDLTPEAADRALAEMGVAEAPAQEPGTGAGPALATEPALPPANWSRSYQRQRTRLERQRQRMERRLAGEARRFDRRHERHLRRDGRYSVDHLIRLRLHGITPEFIEDMREAGYGDLSPEELVELRIHGVSPDYAGEMRELFGELPVDKLVEFRIHGVTPDLVQELQESGVEHPSADDVLRWRYTSVRGTRFGDAVSTAMDVVGPHVTQLVEAALAEARRHILDALGSSRSADAADAEAE